MSSNQLGVEARGREEEGVEDNAKDSALRD